MQYEIKETSVCYYTTTAERVTETRWKIRLRGKYHQNDDGLDI